MKEYIRNNKLQILLFICSIILLAVFFVSSMQGEKLILYRDGYSDESEQEFYVKGLTKNKEKIKVSINPVGIDKENVEKISDEVMDKLLIDIKGKNRSLNEVSSNLYFVSYLDNYGIYVSIIPKDTELIDISGKVNNIGLEKNIETELDIKLNLGEYTKHYSVPIVVMPKNLSSNEKIIREFINYIKTIDEKQKTDSYIDIPNEYKGKHLKFYTKDSNNLLFVSLLCIVIAVLLKLKEKINIKENKKHMEEEMLIDYTEIVAKFMLYISCGYSIRKCIDVIVNIYINDLENGRIKKRYAYDKLKKVSILLNSGANESRVYREIGREYGLRQYMKLFSLLDQNKKTGVKGLYNLLNEECNEAFRDRINFAKRKAQECSTKLILPLILMLGVVLIVVVSPAVISFM